MKNYLCRPQRQGKSAMILCIGLIVASVLSFYLASLFPAAKAVGQLLAVVLLLLLVQISTRFLLTDYRYGFEDSQLLFSSRQGKREKHLGSVPMNSSCRLLDREGWEKEKKSLSVAARFSYCQNLFPKAPAYLLAPSDKGDFLLIFEPDDTLLALLREAISQGKETS